MEKGWGADAEGMPCAKQETVTRPDVGGGGVGAALCIGAVEAGQQERKGWGELVSGAQEPLAWSRYTVTDSGLTSQVQSSSHADAC